MACGTMRLGRRIREAFRTGALPSTDSCRAAERGLGDAEGLDVPEGVGQPLDQGRERAYDPGAFICFVSMRLFVPGCGCVSFGEGGR